MKMKNFIWMCVLLMLAVGMSGCSSDEDETKLSQLCHVWYWLDEMPKNYYDLIVYKPDGSIEIITMIYTDEGVKKKVVNHGRYHLEGDRLTINYDGYNETFIYRIVIEKGSVGANSEEGYIMYQYSDGEEEHSSWYNTFYTSKGIDEAYHNTLDYSGTI